MSKYVFDRGSSISTRGRLGELLGPWNVTGGHNVGAGVDVLGWEVYLECEHGLGMWDGSGLGLGGCG